MDRLAECMKILKEEYGIETMDQLNEAILKMEKIDITPFCKKPESMKGVKACQTQKERASVSSCS